MDERRKPRIIVDQDACHGCQTCYKTCIYGVYRWNKEKNCAEAAYPEECTMCKQCELYCPARCIQVIQPELVFYDPIYDPLGMND